MKRIILLSLCIFLLLNLFSSCVQKDDYIVEYPEMYTPTYCSENYIQADPNLVHLRAADNDLGSIDVPGGGARYCAIKDVPLDEYLLFDEYVMFVPLSYQIVKNKSNTELPVHEILSYKIKSVNIYSEVKTYKEDVDKRKLGLDLVEEYIASVDGAGAEAFQSHIIECLEKCNYHDEVLDFVAKNGHKICLRVIFEDYENLVWDSDIFMQDGNYYIKFYMLADGYTDEWAPYWMPLEQGIVEMVCDFLA